MATRFVRAAASLHIYGPTSHRGIQLSNINGLISTRAGMLQLSQPEFSQSQGVHPHMDTYVRMYEMHVRIHSIVIPESFAIELADF